ncbi:MAG: hypothetical protein AB7H77_00620 [Bdellovibrionales bacterium]
MELWVLVIATAAPLSAAAFVAVAVMWLRKLRDTVRNTLSEAAVHQIHSAHKLGETVAQIQKQQRLYEQQLHNLAQASIRLRQELAQVTHRLEHTEQHEAMRGDRTVH